MAALRDAMLRGIFAAQRIHQAYNIREKMETSSPVDVFSLIESENVSLCFRKLDKLYGAYLPLGKLASGIIINSNHPLYVQRFTAAHELGHHVLNHAASLDIAIFERAPMPANQPNPPKNGLHEREADSFASELLMPKWLIIKCLTELGWSYNDLESPDNLYQLSLRLGVSYTAACWGLNAQGIFKPHVAERYANITPQSLKTKLIPEEILKTNPHRSVWLINDKKNYSRILGTPGDFFVFELQENASSGYEWNIDLLKQNHFSVLDEREKADANNLGAPLKKRVVVASNAALIKRLEFCEKRPWNEEKGNEILLDFSLIDRLIGFYPAKAV